MFSSEVIQMLIKGIGETLYMTLASTLFGYLFGLPMGILLTISDREGIKPNAVLYKIMDVVANIVRSVPFLILLIVLIPFTRFIVGKSYGSTASGDDPRVFCNGRNGGRRRPWRYCDPLRISPLRGRDYVGDGHFINLAGANIPDGWYEAVCSFR